MRVLLDECVPIPLKREFAEFGARTVRDMQWLTLRNGELLLKAAVEPKRSHPTWKPRVRRSGRSSQDSLSSWVAN